MVSTNDALAIDNEAEANVVTNADINPARIETNAYVNPKKIPSDLAQFKQMKILVLNFETLFENYADRVTQLTLPF